MQEKGIQKLANQLINSIYTTSELKLVSIALENLSQSVPFKTSAHAIASDSKLSYTIKKTQILFLFKDLDNEILYTFFSDMFSQNEFWMFSSSQFDYFDEFVQNFQMFTEKITVVNMVTAIEIHDQDLENISKNLSKSLDNHVIIHLQVNPAIIGGAQVRIGNLVFDYSLRSKFHQFQRHWVSQSTKTSISLGR